MNDLNVLFQPVEQYCHREVITCSPDDPVADAAAVMQKRRISSLVVCRDGVPVGMVTDRDLRNKVVAQGLDIRNLTIGKIMNTPLITILKDEFLFEALHRISRYGIHRLVVTDGADALVGIITESDILRIQDSRPQSLILNIEEAIDVKTLNEIHQRIQGLVVHLVGSGVRIQGLVRMIAHLNDQILIRLVDLLLVEQFSDLRGRFAFLVLGSEGRSEQTLKTDQDNALVYVDDLRPSELQRMETFSQTLIGEVIAIGIPTCPGGIMANNPQWRHSLSEWRAILNDWFSIPTPDNILRTSMMVDMRALHGNRTLEKGLREHIVGCLMGNKLFLGHMTANMLRFGVPLGWFGRIKTEKGEHKGQLDLKKAGIFVLTEGVKILSLSQGGGKTGTADRIEQLVLRKLLNRQEADDLAATFYALVSFRLRSQVEALREGRTPDNRISVEFLNRMEKGRLHVALEGVRSFQGMLKRRYQFAQEM